MTPMTRFLTMRGTANSASHVGIGVDVVGGLGYVVYQYGLAPLRSLSYYSVAHADAHPFRFRRVTDLEAHAQIVGAVVEQQDGEDAVIDDSARKVGGALEQRLQIERGVERIRELQEVIELDGVDSRGCIRRTPPLTRADSRLQRCRDVPVEVAPEFQLPSLRVSYDVDIEVAEPS